MTVTKDDITRLAGELSILQEQERQACAAVSDKRIELDAARLAYSEANPHPWIGKKVKRDERYGYGFGNVRTIRGTVQVWSRHRFTRTRGLSRSYGGAKEGELVVISATGKSGWKFDVGTLGRNETAWELDA